MRTLRTGYDGFTLIEVLVFIIVTGFLLNILVLASMTALRATPAIHHQWIAIQSARKCMEWFLGQRRLQGYNTLTCPSTPSPGICAPPAGYAATINVSCSTWNGDSLYKTITVNISGLANASVSTQIGNY